MPTTLTGLLLFVVLLMPGMAYVAIRERDTPEQRRSVFRETALMASVSIVADAAAIAMFALVRVLWPGGTPDAGRLVRDASGYLREEYVLVAVWSAGVLALAVALAAGAAWLVRRRRPHPSTMSSWWILFEKWRRDTDVRDVQVGCVLGDGSYIQGWLGSFSTSADDAPDRDIILTGPGIKMRPLGAGDYETLDFGAVCVSARNIVTMFIAYRPPEPVDSSICQASKEETPGEEQAP